MEESGEIKAEENLKWLVKLKEVILNNQQTWTPKQWGRAGSLNFALCFLGMLSKRRDPHGAACCTTNV